MTEEQVKEIKSLVIKLNKELHDASEIGHMAKVRDLSNKICAICEVLEILGIEDNMDE